MKGMRLASLGMLVLAIATGEAAASARVEEALGTAFTLLAVAILLWVIGNILTYHGYDAGGPKGGSIEEH
jgi:hypothetical protein